jgi:glycosyltransferase involved in cell wall biosynthesis
LTLSPVSFERERSDLGETGEILRGLVNNNINYNIVLIHLTPEFWEQHHEPNKVNVGYVVWETSRTHPDWPKWINGNVNALMVGCDWNVEVFKNSGVKVPIYSVPHGIDFTEFENLVPYRIKGVRDDSFKFYNVSQFTERKNPMSLIKSYWAAFQNDENVALILKTYRANFNDGEKNAIRDTIKRLKNVTPMDSYPPIYLVLDMLSRNEVLGLHTTGDCFVSLDRGEGFGLGGFEAGACGNSIIITGIAGALEYAKPEHSYLVNYTLTPVSGMPWSPWYRGDQMWAQPDDHHAIELMKYVYAHQNESKEKGKLLRQYIKDELSWDKVSDKMLESINKL